MSVDAPPDLKTRHRRMWASGDYPKMVDTFLVPVGERLAAAIPTATRAVILHNDYKLDNCQFDPSDPDRVRVDLRLGHGDDR